jgi:hypothetical protein
LQKPVIDENGLIKMAERHRVIKVTNTCFPIFATEPFSVAGYVLDFAYLDSIMH